MLDDIQIHQLRLKSQSALVNLWRSFVVRATVLLAIGIALALVVMPCFLGLVEWSYELSGRRFDKFDDTALPYIYTAAFGVVVTLLAVLATVGATQAENRKQATIKILLESRLSEQFQGDLDRIDMNFPKGEKVPIGDYESLVKSEDIDKKEVVKSVTRVLNYYEFLAVGILRGNLDEKMLKQTIRRLLCCLVNDMRDIIRDVRVTKSRKKSYGHLVAVFWLWVDKRNEDELDEELRSDRRYLGP